jgi:hypothetical protein
MINKLTTICWRIFLGLVLYLSASLIIQFVDATPPVYKEPSSVALLIVSTCVFALSAYGMRSFLNITTVAALFISLFIVVRAQEAARETQQKLDTFERRIDELELNIKGEGFYGSLLEHRLQWYAHRIENLEAVKIDKEQAEFDKALETGADKR